MHAAIKQHASVIVPVSRIKRAITGNVGDVWSCPPLLKWVVLQAAKQGDAELLGTVLGRKQQFRESKNQQLPQEQLQPAEQQEGQQQQQQQQQAGTSVLCEDMVHNELQLCNALQTSVLGELGFPAGLTKKLLGGDHSDVCVWLTAVASFQVAKFVYECMEFRRSEECEDYNPCFDLSLFGDEWQGRIFDTFSSGPRGDIAETFTSDGPGSSISAHGA